MSNSSRLIKLLLLSVCTNYPRENTTILNEDGDVVSQPDEGCILREPKLLAGHNLTIVTIQDSLTRVTKDVNDKLVGTGLAFDFVNILSEKYGFEYTIILPPENTLGDTDSGIIGMLKNGQADMAAAFLPVFTEYMDFLQYSVSLTESEWVVLMKRPRESASGSGLLAPFDATVWLLILVAVIAVGPVIYLIILIRVRLCRGSEKLTRIFPVNSCVWFVYGALMKQGSILNPISDSSRLLFATWWIFITILTSFYTANLTAFLTLSRFTLPIDSAKDLARGSYRWVAHRGGALQHLITKRDDFRYLNETLQRNLGQFLDVSDEEFLQRVGTAGVMFLREKRAIDYIMFRDYIKKTKDNTEETKKCTFVVTPKSFLFHNVAFGFPQNSTLRSLFDPVLQALVESGIVKHYLRSGLPESKICPLDLGSNERQLQNADLSMTYLVVVAGFAIAASIFIGEVSYRQWRLYKKPDVPTGTDSMWTTHKSQLLPTQYSKILAGARRQNINGREYVVVTTRNGDAKLVPVRAPSAFLFQYAA